MENNHLRSEDPVIQYPQSGEARRKYLEVVRVTFSISFPLGHIPTRDNGIETKEKEKHVRLWLFCVAKEMKSRAESPEGGWPLLHHDR